MTIIKNTQDFQDNNQLRSFKIGQKTFQKLKNITYLLAFALFQSQINGVSAEDGHDHEDEHDDHDDERDFSKSSGWVYGLLFSFLIGIAGVGCAALVILIKKKTNIDFKPIVNILIALASGCLIGDAVVHLLPSGLGIHDHGHGGEDVEINQNLMTLMIVIGFVFVFFIEKLLMFLNIGHTHEYVDFTVDNNRVEPFSLPNQKKIETKDQKQIQVGDTENKQNNIVVNNVQVEQGATVSNDDNTDRALEPVKNNLNNVFNDKNSQVSTDDGNKDWKDNKTEGYAFLLGDMLCNFLDGLAIGSVFASGNWTQGISTVIAITAHELPQEMGEIGILLKAKFSSIQALLCNSAVNMFSVLGAILGLAIGENSSKSQRLMSLFVAGSFLYLGATDLLPQIKNEKIKKYAVLQFLFFLCGFGIMYLILLIEEAGHDDHDDHGEEEEEGHEGHNH